MKLVDFFKYIPETSVICLGRFDGLHLGHKTLIYRGLESKSYFHDDTKLAVFLFQRAKDDDSSPKLISTFRETVGMLSEEPVDYLIIAPESQEFFNIDKRKFLDILYRGFHPRVIVCGEDYTFGNGKKGNVMFLKKFCEEKGILLDVAKTVKYQGEKIASSKIKRYLKAGLVGEAFELLGHNYFIQGKVMQGRGDGVKIGFPTANITIPSEKVPLKEGVYATYTVVNGKKYMSVSNYGTAPTFECAEKILETHIINFKEDLLGKEIKVEFKRYLRGIKKFKSIDALKKQIKEDINSL